jgi:hypothetical protein
VRPRVRDRSGNPASREAVEEIGPESPTPAQPGARPDRLHAPRSTARGATEHGRRRGAQPGAEEAARELNRKAPGRTTGRTEQQDRFPQACGRLQHQRDGETRFNTLHARKPECRQEFPARGREYLFVTARAGIRGGARVVIRGKGAGSAGRRLAGSADAARGSRDHNHPTRLPSDKEVPMTARRSAPPPLLSVRRQPAHGRRGAARRRPTLPSPPGRRPGLAPAEPAEPGELRRPPLPHLLLGRRGRPTVVSG